MSRLATDIQHYVQGIIHIGNIDTREWENPVLLDGNMWKEKKTVLLKSCIWNGNVSDTFSLPELLPGKP